MLKQKWDIMAPIFDVMSITIIKAYYSLIYLRTDKSRSDYKFLDF